MTPDKVRAVAEPADRARAAQREIDKSQRAVAELAHIRAEAVAELRAAGMSHAGVAKALGVSRARAAQLAK